MEFVLEIKRIAETDDVAACLVVVIARQFALITIIDGKLGGLAEFVIGAEGVADFINGQTVGKVVEEFHFGKRLELALADVVADGEAAAQHVVTLGVLRILHVTIVFIVGILIEIPFLKIGNDVFEEFVVRRLVIACAVARGGGAVGILVALAHANLEAPGLERTDERGGGTVAGSPIGSIDIHVLGCRTIRHIFDGRLARCVLIYKRIAGIDL